MYGFQESFSDVATLSSPFPLTKGFHLPEEIRGVAAHALVAILQLNGSLQRGGVKVQI